MKFKEWLQKHEESTARKRRALGVYPPSADDPHAGGSPAFKQTFLKKIKSCKSCKLHNIDLSTLEEKPKKKKKKEKAKKK